MQIDTICQTECSAALLSLMQQVICHAVKDETGSDSFELSLTVTNDDAIRELNRTYRNIDRSTDVLSFPLVDFDAYEDAMQDFEDPEYIDPETGAVALGDIVLSLEHAQQQAAEFGQFPRTGSLLFMRSFRAASVRLRSYRPAGSGAYAPTRGGDSSCL